MEGITIKQLAKQLNLSVSTVSKAFQDSYDINPQTRERVLALAKELNYEPNPYASSLRKQKSRTIAIILPEIANNFFALAIRGIESVAQEKGFHVLIYLTHEDHAKEMAFIQHLFHGRVDGVLMSLTDGNQAHSHIEQLQQKGLPIVFFDRIYENLPTVNVTTNDFESGYAATRHLAQQGCRRIAHLYLSKNLSIANRRKAGYLQALKDHGLPLDEELIIPCTDDPTHNYSLIGKLLQSPARPDGLFSSFEKLALLTYQACEALQLSIPRDLRIISFSNLETAPLLNPSLSTITQPAFEIGKKAASLLFTALEKGVQSLPSEDVVINSILDIRNSSGRF
ncbi:MAG TPA: LacI family DNA-binding transcriptional regulator [Chitinophagaceae bacterium]